MLNWPISKFSGLETERPEPKVLKFLGEKKKECVIEMAGLISMRLITMKLWQSFQKWKDKYKYWSKKKEKEPIRINDQQSDKKKAK